MKFRTLVLAVALGCGLMATTGFAAKKAYKPHKVRTFKPKKNKRYKNSQLAKVKPRKVKKVRK
jgi:hypothetical protein